MDINYNNKYAFAEIWAILNWLGEEYVRKVPKNLLKLFKEERKFGYTPQIDFTKPLENQVRQETKNIIAYLNCSCWIEDENKKAEIIASINENSLKREAEERAQKEREKQLRAQSGNVSLTAQLDRALSDLNGDN